MLPAVRRGQRTRGASLYRRGVGPTLPPGAGAPLGGGLMWADHRATREAAAVRCAGHPNRERMLGHVSPEWGIAKLAWLAGSGGLDGSSGIVVELADWLGFRLS